MTREEVQSEYTRLVHELAMAFIQNEPTYEDLLKAAMENLRIMLSKDIVERVKQLENESQKPMDQQQTYVSATAEDFMKLVEKNEENFTSRTK